MTSESFAQSGARQYTVRPYNQRMATFGVIEDAVRFVPVIGAFADLAFHYPGKLLMKQERRPSRTERSCITALSSSAGRSTSHRKPTCPQASSGGHDHRPEHADSLGLIAGVINA
jgi:hypothetical protein